MEKLITALLTDENGISEEAYNALCDYIDGMDYIDWIERGKLRSLVRGADATDGRFYFPQDSTTD